MHELYQYVFIPHAACFAENIILSMDWGGGGDSLDIIENTVFFGHKYVIL